MNPDPSQRQNDFRLNHKALQLETLYEAGLALSSSLQVEEVVGEILPLAVAMVDARGGFLFLKDETTRRLVPLQHINLTDTETGLLENRDLLLQMRGVLERPNALTIDGRLLPPGFSARHMLLAAMGDIGFIGVLDKESRKGVLPFSEEDGHLLELMARQAGSALSNARLYRRMAEERNLNQSIVSSIAGGVISTNLEGAISRTNPEIKRLFGDEQTFYGNSCPLLFESAGYTRIATAVRQSLADGKERSIAGEAPTPETPVLDANITAMRDEQDELVGLVIALEDQTQQTRVHNLFRRYVSDQVVDLLLETDAPPALGGEKRPAIMLFVDMVRSTELLEEIGPEAMVEVLNACFTRFEDIIFRHRGTLNKYIGDGLLAVFGAPLNFADDGRRALETALEIQAEMERFAAECGQPLSIKQGLSSGEVLSGNIGSLRRMEYTVIGPAVNMAARLCDRARSGQILVNAELYKELRGDFDFTYLDRQIFKGTRTPVEVYRADGPKGSQTTAPPLPSGKRMDTDEVNIELDIPMMPNMEIAASQAVEAVGELIGMEQDKVEEVKMALIEACINAIEHSQSKEHRLRIGYRVTPQALHLVIEDQGHGFDVDAAIEKVKLRRESGDKKRGYGLELMQEFVDKVEISSGEDGTIITLIKRR
jgi:adenylate cyclase